MASPERPLIVISLRLRWLRALVLVASAFAWTPAAGHPTDMAAGPPTTFPATVQRMREEMRGIEQDRGLGDWADVGLHASQLVTLARMVPGFAVWVSSALQDSAVGLIMQAGVRIGSTASAVQRAAESRDAAQVESLTARFAELLGALDAYVPKQYVCPMHCEVGRVYDRPGSCPVCGMYLQLITSDRYSVDVRPAARPIRARVPATLEFQIKDPAGFETRHLQVVHEKLLHLMIVSYDLALFDHVHPVLGKDGRFTLRHTFPTGGRYVLFHDFTPDSVGMQVVPVEVVVEGQERPRASLVVDDDQPKRIDGYEVALTHSGLAPGRECSMTFTLTRRGQPVTDLEPFLGAMGHLMMISEDRAAYVHSHPLEQARSSGASIEFKMTFARTGIYKAWGQFKRRGKVLTVPFVVEVSLDGRSGSSNRVDASTTSP